MTARSHSLEPRSQEWTDGFERARREFAELQDCAPGRAAAIRHYAAACRRNALAPWADDYALGYVAGFGP